jgi:hypothetical protein
VLQQVAAGDTRHKVGQWHVVRTEVVLPVCAASAAALLPYPLPPPPADTVAAYKSGKLKEMLAGVGISI